MHLRLFLFANIDAAVVARNAVVQQQQSVGRAIRHGGRPGRARPAHSDRAPDRRGAARDGARRRQARRQGAKGHGPRSVGSPHLQRRPQHARARRAIAGADHGPDGNGGVPDHDAGASEWNCRRRPMGVRSRRNVRRRTQEERNRSRHGARGRRQIIVFFHRLCLSWAVTHSYTVAALLWSSPISCCCCCCCYCYSDAAAAAGVMDLSSCGHYIYIGFRRASSKDAHCVHSHQIVA